MSDYISVAEFCKMFGVSRQAVQKRIVAGKLKAIKFGQKYLIPVEEVESVKNRGIK